MYNPYSQNCQMGGNGELPNSSTSFKIRSICTISEVTILLHCWEVHIVGKRFVLDEILCACNMLLILLLPFQEDDYISYTLFQYPFWLFYLKLCPVANFVLVSFVIDLFVSQSTKLLFNHIWGACMVTPILLA